MLFYLWKFYLLLSHITLQDLRKRTSLPFVARKDFKLRLKDNGQLQQPGTDNAAIKENKNLQVDTFPRIFHSSTQQTFPSIAMADNFFLSFAFIGMILVLIPLPWHLHAQNAGTCLFMIWTAIGCLIHFVNTLVWSGNLELHSAVWCDIATKLIIGLSVALPCASLCINRRLYLIACVSQVHSTKAEKRRAIFIDVVIGVGLPIIVMALHYIVQGHRFDIFEDIGCWPATVNMAPAYPLVWMWPVLIGFVSMVYCGLSIRALMQRRAEFSRLLAVNHNLSANRYFRLMALATVEIATTTPISIYFLYLNLTTSPPIPWVSLANTHYNFSRIRYVPAFLLNINPQVKLNFNLNRWLFPACALFFFAFFGIAEEARRNYKAFYYLVVKPFGIVPKPQPTSAPPRLIISLPTPHSASAYNMSESSTNWDTPSLKVPEIKDDSSSATGRGSYTESNISIPPSHSPNALTPSADDSRCATSIDPPLLSATETASPYPPSSIQTFSPPVAEIVPSHPDNDVPHSNSNAPLDHPGTEPAPLPMNAERSRPPSQHSILRGSTLSESDISISPAYFSDPPTISSYDRAFGGQQPTTAFTHPYMTQTHYHTKGHW